MLKIKKGAVSASEEVASKGVRTFYYEVDLDAKHNTPDKPLYKAVFTGPWSRHGVDTMLKHTLRALRQYKRELLKEAGNAREPSDYTPTTSKSE